MLAHESYLQTWASALWPLNQGYTEFSYPNAPCTPLFQEFSLLPWSHDLVAAGPISG